MDKLRATFALGASAGLTAQDVFANRISEVEAFRQSLASVFQGQAGTQAQSVAPPRAGRRNVLVYYGIGGIGKTALSRQLEQRLTGNTLEAQLLNSVVTSRFDFGESGDFDLENVLLRIRASLSGIRHSWPAFDLAFQLYWAKNHPGESIPDFIRHNSSLRRYGKSLDLADQMQDVAVQILTELGMSWAPTRIAARIASITHEHLMRSLTYKRVRSACPYFEAIITADDNAEALSYMPSLLDWQLGQEKKEYVSVIFLDTFEAVGGRTSRDVERLVQRLIYLMPHVLFVITGRNRLDWADNAAAEELDYLGPARWPQLDIQNVDLEPRQHLIGKLSSEDCELYLRTVLRNVDGTPALTEPIRRKIIAGSEGLPLYLDLSVTQFMELQATGARAEADVFGGSLSSVVSRIMRNLDDDERNILRGASLLDAFDVDLAHAASGSPDAKIVRFINSALVTAATGQEWPFTLHTQLRRAIQETDHELRDAWSDREWRVAAERIARHLGELFAGASADRDRALVAACFTQTVRLSDLYDTVPRWILDAAQFLADGGAWQALDVRQSQASQQSAAGVALGRGLHGIALRRSGSLEESVAEFDAALSSSALQPNAASLLRLHRAHSLRNSGKYDEAQEEYQLLAAGSGPFANRAILQLADLHYLRGRFRRALAVLDGLDTEGDPDALGEAIRIRAHVHRANCQFDAAELGYRRALELGRSLKSPALEGKALTNLAETLSWMQPSEGLRQANEAIEYNAAIGNQLEVLKAYVAKAVSLRGHDADQAIEEALRAVEASKYRAGGVFALSARAFHQLLRRDPHVAETAEGIARIVSSINVYYYWCEIVSWWMGSSSIPRTASAGSPPRRSDWLDGLEEARSSWIRVLAERDLEND